jgi:hypothetical protein
MLRDRSSRSTEQLEPEQSAGPPKLTKRLDAVRPYLDAIFFGPKYPGQDVDQSLRGRHKTDNSWFVYDRWEKWENWGQFPDWSEFHEIA